MFEYIAVFIIVALAGWYVAKTLWKESKGNGCVGCNCKEKGIKTQELVQIQRIDTREK